MRVTSEIFVRSLLRRCSAAGAFAAIVRHGDDDAGAVYVKVARLDGTAALFGPAAAGVEESESGRFFAAHLGAGAADADIEAILARQASFDPDLWIVEIEDRQGRHFLDDWLVQP